jgi:hypothetical protein
MLQRVRHFHHFPVAPIWHRAEKKAAKHGGNLSLDIAAMAVAGKTRPWVRVGECPLISEHGCRAEAQVNDLN